MKDLIEARASILGFDLLKLGSGRDMNAVAASVGIVALEDVVAEQQIAQNHAGGKNVGAPVGDLEVGPAPGSCNRPCRPTTSPFVVLEEAAGLGDAKIGSVSRRRRRRS